MNYYNIAKKYIEYNEYNNPILPFSRFANISIQEYKIFSQFMENKYNKNWDIKECQHYINFIDYIRSKL